MAKFSRQDYIGIAQVIDTTWRKLLDGAVEARRFGIKYDMEAVVTAFADMFQADNERFDRERFVMACEGESSDGTWRSVWDQGTWIEVDK